MAGTGVSPFSLEAGVMVVLRHRALGAVGAPERAPITAKGGLPVKGGYQDKRGARTQLQAGTPISH